MAIIGECLEIRIWLNRIILILLAWVTLFSAGCDSISNLQNSSSKGCKECHPVKLEPFHDFPCEQCHGGDPSGRTMAQAHTDLVPCPASPALSSRNCGSCHGEMELSARNSPHYQLPSHIDILFHAFWGPETEPPAPEELQAYSHPETARQVVEDLLARRCLRCHPYWEGDNYAATHHGAGCAACHLVSGHRFVKEPPEERCLSCHRQNFTGWDFVGRFEKDLPAEYRAPLRKGQHLTRLYGVEWLPTQMDVHKQAGLSCLSCHGSASFHPGIKAGQTLHRNKACIDCHREMVGKDRFHSQDLLDRASCQVCHAVWQPLDLSTYLVRQDDPDLDEWAFLAVQGSSEVENAIRMGGPAVMANKFSGRNYPGLWFKSYGYRRFEYVAIGMDENGKLWPVRPLLDISISYLDSDDDLVLDGFRPEYAGSLPMRPAMRRIFLFPAAVRDQLPLPEPGAWLPFAPHSIGPADLERTLFVLSFLDFPLTHK